MTVQPIPVIAVPAGTVCAYAGTAAPNGWELCNGQVLEKSEKYAGLFAVIKNTFGGEGNKFALPNYNDGIFLRGGQPSAASGGSERHSHPNVSKNGVGDGSGWRIGGECELGHTDDAPNLPPFMTINFIIKL